MKRVVTRIIHYNLAGLDHPLIPDARQTVKFVQQTMPNADANGQSFQTGKWVVEGTQFSFGLWDTVPVQQIPGYRSYVNGKPATTVPAHRVDTSTMDANVVVTYRQGGVKADQSFHQNIVYQTAAGKVVKTLTNGISGSLKGNTATVSKTTVNICINNNLPQGYHYVSGQLNADETIREAVPAAIKVTVSQESHSKNKTQGPQGKATITFVEQNNEGHVLGTATATGTFASTVDVTDVINDQKPDGWEVDPEFRDLDVKIPGSLTVPLRPHVANNTVSAVQPAEPVMGLAPQGESAEGRQLPDTHSEPTRHQRAAKIRSHNQVHHKHHAGLSTLKAMLGFDE